MDPATFFYVRSWLAVPTADLSALLPALGLVDLGECAFGVGTARAGACFATAPIDGWTLVFGDELALADPSALSAQFGEAHAFLLDDKRYQYSCARARGGAVVREVADFGGERSEDGEPGAGEPATTDGLNPANVLAFATLWGVAPDRFLAAGAVGRLCRTAASIEEQRRREAMRSEQRRVGAVALGIVALFIAGLLWLNGVC